MLFTSYLNSTGGILNKLIYKTYRLESLLLFISPKQGISVLIDGRYFLILFCRNSYFKIINTFRIIQTDSNTNWKKIYRR